MLDILARFSLEGTVISCSPYGNGHINKTWLVETDVGHQYILQKINNSIFRDVPALMRNISAVTSYLHRRGLDERHAMTLVSTTNGNEYLFLSESDHPDMYGYYRIYEYITDSICLDLPEDVRDFRQSALAFGQFQMQLAEFPSETLGETIPHFHDTVSRFQHLHRAIEADAMQRVSAVQREIDFALDQEQYAGFMLDMLKKRELPLRVTHNDTKMNNVMLDATTREALCVIDLDTVMPGLSGNDFGDSIRFGASTGPEDASDQSGIGLSLPLFRAYANGFLTACGKTLTANEIETLPMGAKLMTLECGIRFLTDYLQGDTYFRIHHPRHNLDRTRTQFALVADMDKQWMEMHRIIADEFRK